MPPAIEIQGLTKVYGAGEDQVTAVDNLDLTVEQGEVFGFLGPNGAGKTTTVQMLMQIVFPTSGSARLMGKPAGDVKTREKIGYLPEKFQFHAFLRAEEFLDFHARLYGMENPRRKARVREVLELVGLKDSARSRIRTFSKGMLQRIGLGQAIINDPELLILDEPTSALDPMGRRDVRELLNRLKDSGTTIFLNSHMLSEVEMICGQAAIMNHGRLVRLADMASLTRPSHQVDVKVEALPDAAMVMIESLAKQVEFSRDSCMTVTLDREEQITELAEIIMKSGANLKEFTPRRQPLEDAFIKVIEGEGS